LENLEEMGKFLDAQHQPKVKQEDMDYLNRSSPGPDGFTAEFYETFKEELLTTPHKFLNEIEKEKRKEH
jgi:hypothetical protein